MRTCDSVIICFFAGLLAGCSTPTPPVRPAPSGYVRAVLDPNYSPTPQSRIQLFTDEAASIDDRQFAALLLRQLLTNSFNVVTSAEADFVVAFTTHEETTTNTVTPTPFVTAYGVVGGTPITSFHTTRKIWLVAFATTDLHAGKKKSVWEGYIGTYAANFERDPSRVIRTLLHYFGKDFQGWTELIE